MVQLISKISCLLIIICIVPQNTLAVCERPDVLTGAEDYCWGKTVEILDRLQYSTKSVLNFAKKKLGIGVEEQYTPQKCDYYQCIFEALHMLNGNGYPNYGQIVYWIDNNVVYTHAKEIYDRLSACNNALSDSIKNNIYFSGNLNTTLEESTELQGKCEVLQEFMKCISETSCKRFSYP
ncbi:uncharacterized protein LOC115885215 [Sitophilus oryzae]|uniref:Uncharacterized protein LOC115885215 n=1 Tax=Sitophilus oryzae TaxID=7048 RepID=A0A6J2Y8P3_SITOR|nr:uncharacterized protein LOC115885215 [Sitophilus oryzae]